MKQKLCSWHNRQDDIKQTVPEEEVIRSYIKSERYEAAQEAEQNKAKKTAIRMIKAGKMSLEDIADYTALEHIETKIYMLYFFCH